MDLCFIYTCLAYCFKSSSIHKVALLRIRRLMQETMKLDSKKSPSNLIFPIFAQRYSYILRYDRGRPSHTIITITITLIPPILLSSPPLFKHKLRLRTIETKHDSYFDVPF